MVYVFKKTFRLMHINMILPPTMERELRNKAVVTYQIHTREKIVLDLQ